LIVQFHIWLGALVGLIGAPLAVEVDARIAGVIRWLARARVLALEALERSPPLDQRAVHGKVLVAGQLQRARLRHHGAEKLARHVVLQQARPIAAESGVVEARLVPVEIQVTRAFRNELRREPKMSDSLAERRGFEPSKPLRFRKAKRCSELPAIRRPTLSGLTDLIFRHKEG